MPKKKSSKKGEAESAVRGGLAGLLACACAAAASCSSSGPDNRRIPLSSSRGTSLLCSPRRKLPHRSQHRKSRSLMRRRQPPSRRSPQVCCCAEQCFRSVLAARREQRPRWAISPCARGVDVTLVFSGQKRPQRQTERLPVTALQRVRLRCRRRQPPCRRRQPLARTPTASPQRLAYAKCAEERQRCDPLDVYPLHFPWTHGACACAGDADRAADNRTRRHYGWFPTDVACLTSAYPLCLVPLFTPLSAHGAVVFRFALTPGNHVVGPFLAHPGAWDLPVSILH